MANTLTAIRLVLALPMMVGFARPGSLSPWIVALLLTLAIASDYLDGPLARRRGTASPRGMLFDHATDCLFVTGGLAGAAAAGLLTPILPALIPFAFSQYVVDSYVWSRRRQLRASFLGRWNGVLYFVPLVLIAAGRASAPSSRLSAFLFQAARVLGYVLSISTVTSMIDRATTPSSAGREQRRPC